jgi:hypothetical protein
VEIPRIGTSGAAPGRDALQFPAHEGLRAWLSTKGERSQKKIAARPRQSTRSNSPQSLSGPWRPTYQAESERVILRGMHVHVGQHYCEFSIEELPKGGRFAIVC